jgi:hypothetical protein
MEDEMVAALVTMSPVWTVQESELVGVVPPVHVLPSVKPPPPVPLDTIAAFALAAMPTNNGVRSRVCIFFFIAIFVFLV